MNRCIVLGCSILLFLVVSGAHSQEWSSGAQMSAAAKSLLASLDADQRQAARFPLDAVERGRWSNLPALVVPSPGLMMTEMTDGQRRAVQALLRASMSSQGYAKFTGVMRLEDVLREAALVRFEAMPVEDRTAMAQAFVEMRDPTRYAVAIFGDPGDTDWGWRLAGHHAAANFLVSDGRVAFTPTFLGSSPRRVDSGPYAGMSVLPHEGDRGVDLMRSLTAEQHAKARVSEQVPDDLFAGPGRREGVSDYQGLPAREMTAEQKRLLRVLVEEYVRNADFDAADAQMQAIEAAGWDGVHFSWHGPTERDATFYYRVHGPRVLIEYHRVDENHDHSLVRDPVNDYGTDWLGRHLQEHHPTPEQIRQRMQQRYGNPPGS